MKIHSHSRCLHSLFFLCGLLFSSLLRSADGPIRFRHFSSVDGMASDVVMALSQDRNGKIWVGTDNGVNWYDSQRFFSFYHVANKEHSIANNRIHDLYTDDEGVVWIGTDDGLSRYNLIGNDFTNYFFPEEETTAVLDMAETEDGNTLYLATADGLARFDKEAKTLERLALPGIDGLRAVCRAGEGVLLGTSSGLYRYVSRPGAAPEPVDLGELRPYVTVIFHDPLGKHYWIGTRAQGLYQLDEQFNVLDHYSRDNRPETFRTNTVHALVADSEGNIWIGTPEGLLIYHAQERNFTSYRSSSDVFALKHNDVRSVFRDRQGGMWVGTSGRGLHYYHPQQPRIEWLRHEENVPSAVGHVVNALAVDTLSDVLWIGTSDNGLERYDKSTGRYTYYSAKNGALRSDDVRCLLLSGKEELYIGTYGGGLQRLDVRTGQMACYDMPFPQENHCYALLDYSADTLLVGGVDGLYWLDKKSGRVTPGRKLDEAVKVLFRDSRGRIWAGASENLYLLDEGECQRMLDKEGKTPVDRQIRALCLMEDSRNTIWAGTPEGFYHYDENALTWVRHVVTNSLNRSWDFVNGMAEDTRGVLWLSTYRGIACFHPDENRITTLFIDDFSGNANACATLHVAGQTFYAGTRNGLFSFHPRDYMTASASATAIISGVALQNMAVSKMAARKDVRYLQSSNGRLREVVFPASFDHFKIAVSIIDYYSGIQNRYRFRLQGFEDDWKENRWPRARTVEYKDVPPGRYVFQLNTCDLDGSWGEPTECVIQVTPLWYQTGWAKTLLVLAGLAVLYVIVYFYVKSNRMRVKAQMEHFERLKTEELGQEKIRFYINISHELRTPLSLILAPLEDALSNGKNALSAEVRDSLQYVYRNARKLLDLVNRLLDFRKVEAGTYPLHVQMAAVDEWAYDVLAAFKENARKRGVELAFKSELPDGKLFPADKMYMEIILNNLLSNALKFTPDGGCVSLSLWAKGKNYGFVVRDSGIGIPADKVERIFERFYQADEHHQGTGIGLSLVKVLVEKHRGDIKVRSEEGKYTEFTVTLPAELKAYSAEERAARSEEAPTINASLWMEQGSDSEERILPNEPVEDEQGPDEEQNGEKYTLLLVDDNAEMLTYLKSRLQSQYLILTAGNGEEALELVKEQKVDLILSDVMMPGIDGVKLCSLIKKDIQTSHIPFILLSAKSDVESQITGISEGADDYIPKPFSILLLKGKVKNILQSRERLRHYYANTVEIRADKMTSNPLDEEFVNKAIQVVEAHLVDGAFSADELAAELCMSRSSLYLKMNSIAGEPPANFIRRIRLNKACQLLLEQRYSIADISEMTGFSSPSYFSTCFKKYKGCMPSDYVNSLTQTGSVSES